ncbi:MAG TPA: hypothetical protein VLH83_10245 [Chthoniobacterales bacterium]|nr:hypothetical protein [Chthoniobacterales bacterium]
MGFNSDMMKRAVLVLAGLLSLGSSLPAQGLFGGTLFDQTAINSPWASLESQDRFMFSTAFGSMHAPTQEYLPAFNPSESMSYGYLAPDNKTSVDRVVDLHAPDNVRFGGEIGFLYGKSTGSNGFGREDFAGYVIGTVGNDKFSITAGFYRQETSYNSPRFRR